MVRSSRSKSSFFFVAVHSYNDRQFPRFPPRRSTPHFHRVSNGFLVRIIGFHWDHSLSFKTRDKTLILYTNASNDGWGAQVGREQLQGLWDASIQTRPINLRELEAIRLTLVHTTQSLFQLHLLNYSDNLTTVHCLRKKGSSKVQAITDLVSQIWEVLYRSQVSVRFCLIPGNLNIIADSLSRTQPVNSEGQLNPHIFEFLTELWFLPQIDLFTTSENHQVPFVCISIALRCST